MHPPAGSRCRRPPRGRRTAARRLRPRARATPDSSRPNSPRQTAATAGQPPGSRVRPARRAPPRRAAPDRTRPAPRVRTSRGVAQPAAVMRVGPTRSARSLPRSKSETSLSRLVPTWISTAQASVSANTSQRGATPSPQAMPAPTNTGATAIDSVRGRAPTHQRCQPPRPAAAADVVVSGAVMPVRLPVSVACPRAPGGGVVARDSSGVRAASRCSRYGCL